jgi:nucleoside-diphosphate-sugar epimerase
VKRRPRRVAVTGGAGFIGSHLVEALLARTGRDAVEQVRVLDDLSTGYPERIPADPRVELRVAESRTCSVTSWEAVGWALDGVDTIYHLAAVTSGPESWGDPTRTWTVNTGGTLELLRQLNDAPEIDGDPRRVVLASSSAVYDPAELESWSAREWGTPLRPVTPYGCSKAAADLLANTYGGPFETLCLRCGNVYGPRQRPGTFIAAAMQAARTDSPLELYGRGALRRIRPWVYVSDVVAALLAAGTAHLDPEPGARWVNVGGPRAASLGAVLRHVEAVAGRRIERRYTPGRLTDPWACRLDYAYAWHLLHWRPRVHLRAGISATFAATSGAVDAALGPQ